MPYVVECPSCGKQKLLPAKVPGKLITCLDCKTRWTISASGTATIQAPATPKYTCFTCGDAFDVEDVYDQDGGIICHACYDGQMEGLVVAAGTDADGDRGATRGADRDGSSSATSVIDRKRISPPTVRKAQARASRVKWIVLFNTTLAVGLGTWAVHLYEAKIASRNAAPVVEVQPAAADADWEMRNASLVRQLITEADQAGRDGQPHEQLVKLQQLHDLVNHQRIGDKQLEHDILTAMDDWRRLSAPLNHPKVAEGQAGVYTAQP